MSRTRLVYCSYVLSVALIGGCGAEPEEQWLLAPQTDAQAALFKNGPVCDPGRFTEVAASYNFEGALEEHFLQNPRWLSRDATLSQVGGGKAEITASGTHISEAWLTWRELLPYDESWMIASHIKVPRAWDKEETKAAQVGIGMFVGKSSAADPDSKDAYNRQSPTVYEVNLATMAREVRFIQAQMINNRLGFDPDQTAGAKTDLETLELKILYCAGDNTLSVYYDAERLDTQAINEIGFVNWQLAKGAVMDVGIMGFAENSDLTRNSPSVSRFRVMLEKQGS